MTKISPKQLITASTLENAYERYYKTVPLSSEEEFPRLIAPEVLFRQELAEKTFTAKWLAHALKKGNVPSRDLGPDATMLASFVSMATTVGVTAATSGINLAAALGPLSMAGVALLVGGIVFAAGATTSIKTNKSIDSTSRAFRTASNMNNSEARDQAFIKWAEERYDLTLNKEHLKDIAAYGVCQVEDKFYAEHISVSKTGTYGSTLAFAIPEAIEKYLASKNPLQTLSGEVPLSSKTLELEYMEV